MRKRGLSREREKKKKKNAKSRPTRDQDKLRAAAVRSYWTIVKFSLHSHCDHHNSGTFLPSYSELNVIHVFLVQTQDKETCIICVRGPRLLVRLLVNTEESQETRK